MGITTTAVTKQPKYPSHNDTVFEER